MSAEDNSVGAKRDRQEPGSGDEPVAKEARVDAAANEPASTTEEAPATATDAAAPVADEQKEEQPAPIVTLEEALELLAPKVTKRLAVLHESGLVAESEVEASTLHALGEFTPVQAVEIIDQLTEENLQGFEDKNKLIREVMDRFRAPPAPAVKAAQGPRNSGPRTAPSAAVSGALEKLYASGTVTSGKIDGKMLDHLASMPEPAAVASIDELATSDLSGIRNLNGYLKSICRRHEGPREDRRNDTQSHDTRGGFHSGARRAAPPEAFFEIQRRFQMGVITGGVAMRLEQFYQDTGANLDSAAWDMMLQLNEPSAMAAINEVHSACRGDRAVRNPSAFFTGIARKHRTAMEQGRPFAQLSYGGGGGGYGGHGGHGGHGGYGGGHGGGRGGYGGGPPPGVHGGRGGGPVNDETLRAQLPASVYQRISNASAAGKFNIDAIDQRALDTLLKLDEPTAAQVIDEIEGTDLARIRNFAGYFMGICNKFLRGGPEGAQQRY